jgi:dienelactone hydrolase
MAPVVLVHGLWHDPAHFDLVAGPLRAAGALAAAPELLAGR